MLPTPYMTLELPSRASSVAELDSFVDELLKSLSLCQDLKGKLLISLSEAVNNAIRHGNKLDPDKRVEVTVWNGADTLKICVSDEGDGFHPDDVSDPTCPSRLNQEGGRGVFLMSRLCDELAFKEDGSLVEMSYNT